MIIFRTRKLSQTLLCLIAAVIVSSCATLAKAPETEEIAKTENEINFETSEYIKAGDEAYFAGDLETALVQYLLAIENRQNDPDLFARAGTVLRKQGNLDAAQRSYNRALAITPSHIPSREGLGLVNLKKENYKLAQTMLEGVVSASKDRWQSLSALGVVHDLQAEYDTAQSYYKKALVYVPASAKIRNNLGYSYYLQGKLQLAERTFKEVVQQHPRHSVSWSNLALVYMQKNEVDNAKLAFEKTVSEYQALNNIGYIELLNNNQKDARKRFVSAIDKSPSFYPVAQQNIASLNSRTTPEPASPVTEIKSIRQSSNSDTSRESIVIASADAGNSVRSADIGSATATATANTRAKSIEAETVKPAIKTAAANTGSAKTHSTSPASAERTDIHPLLARENILYVQEKLMLLGYNPGPIDGKLGRKTQSAIRNFQRTSNMTVTGRISKTLMERL